MCVYDIAIKSINKRENIGTQHDNTLHLYMPVYVGRFFSHIIQLFQKCKLVDTHVTKIVLLYAYKVFTRASSDTHKKYLNVSLLTLFGVDYFLFYNKSRDISISL